jgi:hypothetical protein
LLNDNYNSERVLIAGSINSASNAKFRCVSQVVCARAKHNRRVRHPEGDIYNFDVTRFLMGQILSEMVVTSSKRRGKPRVVQQGIREWVTVIQGVSSQGWAGPPYIIVAGKYHLSSWCENSPLLRTWRIALSDNGWTTNDHGLEWI